jgi:pimeloyl-ACP methyl ester carboxylesterase
MTTCVLAAAGAAAALGAAGCGATSPVLRFRTDDGFTIAAEVHLPPPGDRPAPLIVLGHQLNRDRHSWDPLIPRLLDEGYAVVAVDHRGFGESVLEARSPARLSQEARAHIELDLLGAIRAATRRRGVDASRVAVIGTGVSGTAAARCAREDPSVRAVVLFVGVLEPDAEEYLLETPDLPLLIVASRDDARGAALMRQYGERFTGPQQQYVEMEPVPGEGATDWRGTDGLASDTGLPDVLLWFLRRSFPARGAGSSPGGAVGRHG